MPSYQFNCVNPQCTEKDKVLEINMKMSEYTSEQYCPTCNKLMDRVVGSLVCGYKNTSGFFGKKGMY